MRLSRTVALALAAVPTLSAHASAQRPPLEARIRQIMERPEFAHATWGIQFTSLDSGRVVYALNEQKLFTPGSTTKLLTMGTALGVLGADYRFTTRVYRTGPVRAGVLEGDLVLLASGDPNLSARLRPNDSLAFENVDHSYDADPNTRAVRGDPLAVLRGLARQVREKGITRVRGSVIVDASLFPEGERELGTGVVISPVVVNDNLVDVVIGPGHDGGPAASLTVSPGTAYVHFINKVVTAPSGTQPSIRWSSDSARADGSRVVTASGVFPRGSAPILYSYAVPQPSRFAEVTFAEVLRAAGVVANARPFAVKPQLVRLRASYGPANMIAEHRSAPLGAEARVTLKVSQNLHASMMPYVLGALRGSESAATGFDVEREFLTSMRLDLAGAQQGDGAGGDAHYTPALMVSFLAAMEKRPDFPTFLAALPVLGRDGTLFDIQRESPAAGHVFAKTGTFSVGDPLNRRVLVTGKGLAGYMTTAQGERLAFAIYVNNVSVSTAPDEVKRVVGQALGQVAAAAYEGR
ncbi:MAG TPA: D-alanyl-D-alanine carboxypeptidase/D-alanyl-D-alanine-endopeptidase [Gemmatimonadaceae bacterium]|nr:D-alanyl-D-alanine carboxypeptidase/D-alanyl-D-alanine-endopeptidase [Gemmatimonadaceae bacterium]